MIRPLKGLILLFYVGVMSGLVMLMSPGEIALGEGVVVRVPVWSDVFESAEKQVNMASVTALESKVDSLDAAVEKISAVRLNVKMDSMLQVAQATEELEEADSTTLYFPDESFGALTHFFHALDSLPQTRELIRIIHYGDSQLEGDRITEYIRNRMQNRFGGCGVGMAAVIELKNSRTTLIQSNSDNWAKYAVYGENKKGRRHNFFGTLGAYYAMGYPNGDGTPTKAWMRFKRSEEAYQRASLVERMQILYRSEAPVVFHAHLNDTAHLSKEMKPENLGICEIELNSPLEELKLEVEAPYAEVLGVTFDCQSGIAVDNVAMRGSSGLEFTQIPKPFYREQIQRLNTKLLIVQFGVNVIPYLMGNFEFYEQNFYRQLQYLKSLSPDMDIVVVGVSDMAHKKGTSYESYPNVPFVRDAQRKAAFRAGCAFWDLYKAMGGKDSMLSWASNKSNLAAKDYTHFTRKGARVVGEMMYNELMRAYERHRKGLKPLAPPPGI